MGAVTVPGGNQTDDHCCFGLFALNLLPHKTLRPTLLFCVNTFVPLCSFWPHQQKK